MPGPPPVANTPVPAFRPAQRGIKAVGLACGIGYSRTTRRYHALPSFPVRRHGAAAGAGDNEHPDRAVGGFGRTAQRTAAASGGTCRLSCDGAAACHDRGGADGTMAIRRNGPDGRSGTLAVCAGIAALASGRHDGFIWRDNRAHHVLHHRPQPQGAGIRPCASASGQQRRFRPAPDRLRRGRDHCGACLGGRRHPGGPQSWPGIAPRSCCIAWPRDGSGSCA